jgi:hypothetical protein
VVSAQQLVNYIGEEIGVFDLRGESKTNESKTTSRAADKSVRPT